MAETAKSSSQSTCSFFSYYSSHSDNKWRIKEVRATGAIVCDTKEEALRRVRELKNEVERGHAVVHDEHGQFEIVE